ncbi:MAG: hypothetical protein L3J91_00135 [Thermoplasmata archaeon]|nr:hypothetical protein [Thermoplasmata archaeon]
MGGRSPAGDGGLSVRGPLRVPGKKIVQEWRGTELGWLEDHDTISTSRLTPIGPTTRRTFTPTGVPQEYPVVIVRGWKDLTEEPLRQYLTAGRGEPPFDARPALARRGGTSS